MFAFKPIHWLGLAAASIVVGFASYKATKANGATTKTTPGVEPTCSKGWFWDPVTKQCIEDLSDEGEVVGTAEKSLVDQNGVTWSLYRHNDGSWEGNPLEANPAYVKVFHEPTIEDLKFLIRGHAATYNANGTLKLDLGGGTLPPASGLPNYVQGAKCGTYYCWYLVDPSAAIMLPPGAQSSPLNVGDVVAYYIGDDPDAVKTNYLAMITAMVTGPKINDATSIQGSYPLKILTSTLLRGTAPTKLPPIGLNLDQWRQGLIPASLVV